MKLCVVFLLEFLCYRSLALAPVGFIQCAGGICGSYVHKTTHSRRFLMSDQQFMLKDSVNVKSDIQNPFSSFLQSSVKKIAPILLSGLLIFGSGSAAFPQNPITPVFDEGKAFGAGQKLRTEQELSSFEAKTGWKVRILTRDSRRPEPQTSPQQIRTMWQLPDAKSVVVILDISNSNVLGFNSGAETAKLLPQGFFNELTGRLGNIFAVRKTGEAGAAVEAARIIQQCLVQPGGCPHVPGVGDDQYTASVAGSIAGGVVFGFSLLTAEQFWKKEAKGEDVLFRAAPLLFMPLWGTLFFGLGINPLLQRQVETAYLLQNAGTFAVAAAVTAAVWPSLARLEPPSIKW